MNLGVLASGEGSNLQAILDRVHGREGVRVVAVGSDKAEARALMRAHDARDPRAGVPGRRARRPARARRRDRGMAGRRAASSSSCSPATCSSSTRRSSPASPARDQRAPGAAPAFPGIGAVEQALAHGVKVVGVTVHFVDEGVDTGPIIAQRAIDLPDAADAAAVRDALRPLEHDLLCDAVRLIARGAVGFDADNPRRVVCSAEAPLVRCRRNDAAG